MPHSPASPSALSRIGLIAVLASLLSQNVGASFAKQLFHTVGAGGMSALRIGLAAALLVLLRRSWRQLPARPQLPMLLAYGIMLGLMNVLIYQAFARIPIGIAVAIEVLGPLAVMLSGARRLRDLPVIVAAVGGLALLLPLGGAGTVLDPLGMACAIGAAICWALYIVFGKRASQLAGVDTVSWGMVIAATFAIPLGICESGSLLLSPQILLIGLLVAALSSALPYSLEMWALRRLPAHLFGLLMAAAPAVAALTGYAILGEQLSLRQWLAILLIVAAVATSMAGPAKPATP